MFFWACVDRENLLTDGGGCGDLMRTLFYVGMDCKTTEEAQKSCCLSCSKSEYFDGKNSKYFDRVDFLFFATLNVFF